MSNTTKGIISGFVASVVLGALMFVKIQWHLTPEFSVIALLSKLAGGWVGGWMDHFIIGVLVWGMLFAGFDAVTNLPYWLKGMIFSLFGWLIMMLVFLPFVGLGFFGLKAGYVPAVLNLIEHLIYGFVLGVTYGLLSAWAPAKAPQQRTQS